VSAAELIKQVAALPPEERMAFERLFRAMKTIPGTPKSQNGVEWPDFAERLEKIYGNRVAPDSQPIINEGRGDR